MAFVQVRIIYTICKWKTDSQSHQISPRRCNSRVSGHRHQTSSVCVVLKPEKKSYGFMQHYHHDGEGFVYNSFHLCMWCMYQGAFRTVNTRTFTRCWSLKCVCRGGGGGGGGGAVVWIHDSSKRAHNSYDNFRVFPSFACTGCLDVVTNFHCTEGVVGRLFHNSQGPWNALGASLSGTFLHTRGYATEWGTLYLRAAVTDTISAPRKVWVLIWKQHNIQAEFRSSVKVEVAVLGFPS